MSNPFFERPILNSPYEYPRQHWELDLRPAHQESSRPAAKPNSSTPIPKPRKQKGGKPQQQTLASTRAAASRPPSSSTSETATVINELRAHVDALARTCRTRSSGA